MQDVARAAGVHQTTVSLALRNDSRLPEQTRKRVREIAEKIGYRPDPMLAALNFYRASRHAVKAPPTMAFLVNFRDRAEMSAYHAHEAFLHGAQLQAEQLGYRLEPFFIGHDPHAGRRLDRILRTRGINGVIGAAFADTFKAFELSWEHYSAVLIDSQQLRLPLHTVSNHQQNITREAIARLQAAGYRRIGLVVGTLEENNLRNAFTAGYYVETAQQPSLQAVPPLVLDVRHNEQIAGPVSEWIRRHDVEVVISNWNNIRDSLRLTTLRVPGDVVVVSLDVMPDSGVRCGMKQNHVIVGRRAVEQLAIQMRSHQRGLVEAPNTTLIEGEWVPGDLPVRAAVPATIAVPEKKSDEARGARGSSLRRHSSPKVKNERATR
jgi:LacI family transcriptional regulator